MRIAAVETAAAGWAAQLIEWDRSWIRVRLPLLIIGLLGLLHAYTYLPHRGPEPASSRYQTLTVTVESVGRTATAWEALSNMRYLNASYEDPGIYWLTSFAIAGMKAFNPDYQPVESLIYPVQFFIFALALVLLSCRVIPLSVAIPATAAFLLAFQCNVLYWSWDVYWAPALSVFATMVFLLSATTFPERGPWRWIVAAGMGAFVGLMGLIRQDSGLVAQASALGFAAILLFYGLPTLIKDRIKPVHVKATILVICFLAATFIPRLAFRSHVTLAQWVNQEGPPVRGNLEHGKWHNVYLGIGFNIQPFASPTNPYGIAWDDTVGAFHAAEHNPAGVFGQPDYMPTLRKLLTKIIVDDPVFYAKTVAARFLYELILIYSFAVAGAGWLAYTLVFWPLLLLTPVFISGRRAADSFVYLIVVAAAFAPPVLTFPAPPYSMGIAMGILASPLFFFGSLLEAPKGRALFPLLQTKRLVFVLAGFLAIGSVVFGAFAVGAHIYRNAFLSRLLGEPADLAAAVQSDPWRVDRHFNHSLSSAHRKAAAERVHENWGQVTGDAAASVEHSPDARLRIINVTQLPEQIFFLVESRRELDYGIFLLKAKGAGPFYYRKALNWRPQETYLLIFNTGKRDAASEGYTLSFKEDTAGFTTEPNIPVAVVDLSSIPQ